MNANEDIRNDMPEEIIELGVASIETKGTGGFIENLGNNPLDGISDA